MNKGTAASTHKKNTGYTFSQQTAKSKKLNENYELDGLIKNLVLVKGIKKSIHQ